MFPVLCQAERDLRKAKPSLFTAAAGFAQKLKRPLSFFALKDMVMSVSCLTVSRVGSQPDTLCKGEADDSPTLVAGHRVCHIQLGQASLSSHLRRVSVGLSSLTGKLGYSGCSDIALARVAGWVGHVRRLSLSGERFGVSGVVGTLYGGGQFRGLERTRYLVRLFRRSGLDDGELAAHYAEHYPRAFRRASFL
jgi:hypothetical protein